MQTKDKNSENKPSSRGFLGFLKRSGSFLSRSSSKKQSVDEEPALDTQQTPQG
jgi:hypothetical protein